MHTHNSRYDQGCDLSTRLAARRGFGRIATAPTLAKLSIAPLALILVAPIPAGAQGDDNRAGSAYEREMAAARDDFRRSMADGAAQLENGADEVLEGAERLETEARKLRDPAYRDEQIERAARRGDRVTHDELLALIPQFRAQAAEMREQAADMRVQAREMANARF